MYEWTGGGILFVRLLTNEHYGFGFNRNLGCDLFPWGEKLKARY